MGHMPEKGALINLCCDWPVNPNTLRKKKIIIEMAPYLPRDLKALKLNSLSNARTQEKTFMDLTRDNIIRVCYYPNSSLSQVPGMGRRRWEGERNLKKKPPPLTQNYIFLP